MDHHESHLSGLIAGALLSLTMMAGGLPARADIPASFESLSADPPGTTFRWTPELGVAFPQPVSAGVEMSCSGDSVFCRHGLRYYMDAGYFRAGFGAKPKVLSIIGLEGGVRFIPGETHWILGVGLGFRRLGFSAGMADFTIEGTPVASNASIHLNTGYIVPSVGYSFDLTRRLSLQLEAGIELPFYALGSLTLDSAGPSTSPSDLQVNSHDAMTRIAGLIVPKITLFRLQWSLTE